MPSKSKPLTEAQLRAYEFKRDLAAELLESVQQMKAGKTQVVSSPAIEARERTGLSQSQFSRSPARTLRHCWRLLASSGSWGITDRSRPTLCGKAFRGAVGNLAP